MDTGTPALYSTTIRGGNNTYSIDVREAKNGRKYLSLTETHLEGEERKRSSMRVFGETIEPFRHAVEEAVAALAA